MKKCIYRLTINKYNTGLKGQCHRLYIEPNGDGFINVARNIIFRMSDEPQIYISGFNWQTLGYSINIKAKDAYLQMIKHIERNLRTKIVKRNSKIIAYNGFHPTTVSKLKKEVSDLTHELNEINKFKKQFLCKYH